MVKHAKVSAGRAFLEGLSNTEVAMLLKKLSNRVGLRDFGLKGNAKKVLSEVADDVDKIERAVIDKGYKHLVDGGTRAAYLTGRHSDKIVGGAGAVAVYKSRKKKKKKKMDKKASYIFSKLAKTRNQTRTQDHDTGKTVYHVGDNSPEKKKIVNQIANQHTILD